MKKFLKLLFEKIKKIFKENVLLLEDKKENEDLNFYIDMLSNTLDEEFYLLKVAFILSQEFREQFYATMNQADKYNNNLIFLMEKMLAYVGLPPKSVKLKIIYQDIFDQSKIAGEYKKTNVVRNEINLYLNYYSTLESIVSILAHEISHYLLYLRNIKIEDTAKNEILTDVCAVYLGFGKYMLEGYKKNEYTKGDKTITSKIGYITVEDIKYIMSKIEKIKSKYIIYL